MLLLSPLPLFYQLQHRTTVYLDIMTKVPLVGSSFAFSFLFLHFSFPVSSSLSHISFSAAWNISEVRSELSYLGKIESGHQTMRLAKVSLSRQSGL